MMFIVTVVGMITIFSVLVLMMAIPETRLMTHVWC